VLEAACTELRRFGCATPWSGPGNALGGPATVTTERELDEAEAYLETRRTWSRARPVPSTWSALDGRSSPLYVLRERPMCESSC